MCVVFLEEKSLLQWRHRLRYVVAIFSSSNIVAPLSSCFLKITKSAKYFQTQLLSTGSTSFACALRVLGAGKPFLLMLKKVVELRGTRNIFVTVGQSNEVTRVDAIRGSNMWNHHVVSPTNWIAYLTTVEELL